MSHQSCLRASLKAAAKRRLNRDFRQLQREPVAETTNSPGGEVDRTIEAVVQILLEERTNYGAYGDAISIAALRSVVKERPPELPLAAKLYQRINGLALASHSLVSVRGACERLLKTASELNTLRASESHFIRYLEVMSNVA
jgi:uncharacterized protein YqfB (UPF0267 family)